MTALLDEDTWRSLHDARLRGMVEGDDDPRLAALADLGYLTRRGTRLVVTSTGRSVHAEWARLPAGSDGEAAARRAYDHFLDLDPAVKQVTTEWQLASSTRSAGGFRAEDWNLVDRLAALHERAGPVLGRLGHAVPRFLPYRPRLRHALTRLQEGEGEWFSGLRCDSYHTVWWQLHEDLLLALGIDRSDDPNQ